jgi:nicotinate-nucleotide adenylyltransferase
MVTPPRATGLARQRGTEQHQRHRLGVMGGTFDPIHHGHLVAASEVAGRFGLDEVVFVPTGQPWQKTHRQVSSPEDR